MGFWSGFDTAGKQVGSPSGVHLLIVWTRDQFAPMPALVEVSGPPHPLPFWRKSGIDFRILSMFLADSFQGSPLMRLMMSSHTLSNATIA